MVLRWPPIFLLPTHLAPEELHRLEDSIPSLTYDVDEAEVVVGNITKRERAMFELRRVRLETEPIATRDDEPAPKRPRLATGTDSSSARPTVKVLKLAWLTDSLGQGVVLPTDDYLLYEGRKTAPTAGRAPKPPAVLASPVAIVERAAGDQASSSPRSRHSAPQRDYGHGRSHKQSSPPTLLRQTTSEHDAPLKPLPPFLATTYSCQRPTPVHPPNAAFVEELKMIRTLRKLEGDQVGVRAYSTSIATVAAYPHQLQGPLGILQPRRRCPCSS